jgi:hypothetical protein
MRFLLSTSPKIIRVMEPWEKRWAGHVAGMGKKINACKVWVRETEGQGPRGIWTANSGLGPGDNIL